MAYLTLNGSFTVPVKRDSASEPEPEVGGESFRAFAGNLRSTRRWVKRHWTFTTIPMTYEDIASLVAIIGSPAGGNFVTCNGTFNNNVGITCQVIITTREPAKESNTVVRQRLTLAVTEV